MSTDDKKNDEKNSDSIEIDLDRDLLDDSDFANLMSAEFEAGGSPEDKLSTKRVWSSVEKGIDSVSQDSGKNQLNPKKSLNLIQYFAIAAVLALAVSGIFNQQSAETDRLKGNTSGIPVTLSAKNLGSASTDTFKFSVDVSQNSWSLLLKKHGQENWEIVSNTFECVAGNECPVEMGVDLVYGYELDDSEKTQFCSLAAVSKDDLELLTTKFIDSSLDDSSNFKDLKLPESSCISLEKGRQPYR